MTKGGVKRATRRLDEPRPESDLRNHGVGRRLGGGLCGASLHRGGLPVMLAAMQDYILTFVGPDRRGLVEQLAGAVTAAGGNWLESRLVHLGGQFAGVARVALPAGGAEAVRRAAGEVEAQHITLTPAGASGNDAAPAVTLEVVGHDRPGIVRQIAAAVARHGGNVEELHSTVTSAPMSGEPLFRAVLRLSGLAAPAGLRAELEDLASDLMVDVVLTES